MWNESNNFIWNTEKELINIHKHGIDFHTAAMAFKDSKRKIYIDSKHSKKEVGEKENSIMKKKMIDADKPLGKLKRITDFLPPPEDLVIPEKTIKVTLSLSKASVAFFKHKAYQHHTKYQKMIRRLLDQYALQYS